MVGRSFQSSRSVGLTTYPTVSKAGNDDECANWHTARQALPSGPSFRGRGVANTQIGAQQIDRSGARINLERVEWLEVAHELLLVNQFARPLVERPRHQGG